MVSHALRAYTMNRHMKNAIQNMMVLKPRPSWNRCRIGALSALSWAGTAKRSVADHWRPGARAETMCRNAASSPLFSRKGIDSGSSLRMAGTSRTGRPAARKTDCQPYVSIRPLPRMAASMPPTA
ncbi:hypothetical protein D9M70_495600 [compost metagenome]